MVRTCTVCRHDQREAIDRALVGGAPERTIAHRYGVSRDAVHRHKPHATARLAKAREARETTRADGLLAGVVRIREKLEAALDAATLAKDVASLAREARETLRLLLEVEGRLRQSPAVQVNVAVMQSPEWLSLEARIVSALGPFAEARAAVLAAIEGRDAGPGSPRALAGQREAAAAVLVAASGEQ